MTYPQIIYEDNHLIAINKRVSDIVQGDKTGDLSLDEIMKGFLREKYHKQGNVFLGVIHRLDRPVSGVVLFAKTGKALVRMNEQFKERQTEKIYWAVVREKPPKDEDILVHYLLRDREKNKTFVYEQERPGTKRAEMKYRVTGRSQRYYFLEIILFTGRHHQIRAQLSAIGCPVRGDLKYGYPRPDPYGGIHLHARILRFTHPVRSERITLLADPPDDPLWRAFSELYD